MNIIIDDEVKDVLRGRRRNNITIDKELLGSC